MKNIILLSIVIVLVLTAYFHEEIGKKEKEHKFLEEHRIVSFNPEMIDQISLPRTKLLKKDHEWFVGDLNYRANNLAVENLLKHLCAIRQLKVIDVTKQNRDEFFTHQNHKITLSSFGKVWKYRLGDVSELTGNFYFADVTNAERGKEKVFIARDTTTFEGLYKSELELYLNQYIQLKDYILASPQAYLEPKVFYDMDIERIESIKIDNKWNRWFEVSLESKTTTPPIQNGLEYLNLKMLVQTFINDVVHEQIVKEGVLGEVISTVTFKGMTKSVQARLHKELDGRAGYYVTFDGSKWIYKLKKEAQKLFFLNVQEFWDKKVNYPVKLDELNRIDFAMGADKKNMINFYVDDLKSFEFKSDSPLVNKINVKHMNFLFHLLLGLEDFEQASRVEDIKKDERSYKGKNNSIYVRLFDTDLKLIFHADYIIMKNLTAKYQLHFNTSFAKLEILSIHDFFALE